MHEVLFHVTWGKGPASGFELFLGKQGKYWIGAKEGVTAKGVTRSDGSMRMLLDAKEWTYFELVNVLIRSPAKQIVFSGKILLEPSITITLPKRQVLHGRVVTPLPAGKNLRLGFYYVSGNRPSERFLGWTKLQRDGSFELDVHSIDDEGKVRVSLVVENNHYSTLTTMEVLISQNGAALEFRLTPVVVRTFAAEQARPLAGVVLNLRSKQEAFQYATAMTDEQGRATVLVPKDKEVFLLARKRGYAYQLLKISDDNQNITMYLMTSLEDTRINGKVVDSNGNGVSGAVISLIPYRDDRSPMIFPELIQTVRSDNSGRFSFLNSYSFPIEIGAWDKRFGFSERIAFFHPQQTYLIQFGSTTNLIIDIHGLSYGRPVRRGEVRWLLLGLPPLHRIRTGVFSLGTNWIETVPLGSYKLFLVAEDGSFFGEKTVLAGGRARKVDAYVLPAGFFEGAVHGPAVERPMKLHLVDVPWARKAFLGRLYQAKWKGPFFRLFGGVLTRSYAVVEFPGEKIEKKVLLESGKINSISLK